MLIPLIWYLIPLIMHIFAASSLFLAVKTLPGGVRKRKNLTTIPGLHLVENSAKYRKKTVQFQLKFVRNQHSPKPEVVIWHDVINNSITPHPSNYNNPLDTQQLILVLRKLPVNIKAIVYCQREGAPDIFPALNRNFLTIHVVKETLSDKKLRDHQLLLKYQKLHLDRKLELKLYLLVSKHISNLLALKNKKKRPNNRRRKTNFRRQFQNTWRNQSFIPYFSFLTT